MKRKRKPLVRKMWFWHPSFIHLGLTHKFKKIDSCELFQETCLPRHLRLHSTYSQNIKNGFQRWAKHFEFNSFEMLRTGRQNHFHSQPISPVPGPQCLQTCADVEISSVPVILGWGCYFVSCVPRNPFVINIEHCSDPKKASRSMVILVPFENNHENLTQKVHTNLYDVLTG